MVDETVDLFKSIADEKNIDLTFDSPKKVFAYCDYDSTNTIVRNLVSNALKFTMPNGKVSVFVQNSGSNVKINVKDTGVGMSEEEMAKIFSINHKYSTKGTAKEEGTGLGLALCKEFASRNNGDLQVESIPDKGSIFTLYLLSSGQGI
jgi:signal transduction histidine kinase